MLTQQKLAGVLNALNSVDQIQCRVTVNNLPMIMRRDYSWLLYTSLSIIRCIAQCYPAKQQNVFARMSGLRSFLYLFTPNAERLPLAARPGVSFHWVSWGCAALETPRGGKASWSTACSEAPCGLCGICQSLSGLFVGPSVAPLSSWSIHCVACGKHQAFFKQSLVP